MELRGCCVFRICMLFLRVPERPVCGKAAYLVLMLVLLCTLGLYIGMITIRSGGAKVQFVRFASSSLTPTSRLAIPGI